MVHYHVSVTRNYNLLSWQRGFEGAERERVENEKCAWVSDCVSASQEKNIFPFLEKSSTTPKHSRHGVKT